MGHPPTCTPNVVNECTSVQRSKIFKQKWNISIHYIFIDFWLISGVHPPWGWGWVDGGGILSGCLGSAPCMCACACMHTCTCAYMYKHDNFMQMAAPIGKSWGIPLWHHHSCACMCVRACAHMHGASPKHPDRVPTPSTHPHPLRGGWTPVISQKSIKI